MNDCSICKNYEPVTAKTLGQAQGGRGMKQICGDCLHYNACAAWNIGSLANTDAGNCINFEHIHLYDSVGVVRCKDCRYWDNEFCMVSGIDRVKTDYCSRGVRKEGEE